jgi:hypothetical protein
MHRAKSAPAAAVKHAAPAPARRAAPPPVSGNLALKSSDEDWTEF